VIYCKNTVHFSLETFASLNRTTQNYQQKGEQETELTPLRVVYVRKHVEGVVQQVALGGVVQHVVAVPAWKQKYMQV